MSSAELAVDLFRALNNPILTAVVTNTVSITYRVRLVTVPIKKERQTKKAYLKCYSLDGLVRPLQVEEEVASFIVQIFLQGLVHLFTGWQRTPQRSQLSEHIHDSRRKWKRSMTGKSERLCMLYSIINLAVDVR